MTLDDIDEVEAMIWHAALGAHAIAGNEACRLLLASLPPDTVSRWIDLERRDPDVRRATTAAYLNERHRLTKGT